MKKVKTGISILKQDLLICEIEMRNFFLSIIPTTRLGNYLKKYILSAKGAKIGNNLYVYPNVFIDFPKHLRIGNDVVISRGALLTTSGTVEIGNRVLIGYDAKILSTNHIIPSNINASIRFSGHERKPIKIADDVWICANAVITAGVMIGKGAVVAAGAVVTEDVESYTIVGGIPAKVIKSRINRTDQIAHEY
mgnify:CR=1 FL=1